MEPTITTAILTHPVQTLLAVALFAHFAREIFSRIDWSNFAWPQSDEFGIFIHLA